MSRPTAAPSRWPYRDHRTVEQVDNGFRMSDERVGRIDRRNTIDGSKMLLAAITREQRA